MTWPSQAACVLFVNRKGELLLQLRDNGPYTAFPNHWGLIGGTVEAGETVEEGLIREAFEEIGEQLTDYRFLWTARTMYIDIHVFIARLDRPAESIVLTEGQCVRYFSPDDAMGLPCVPWLYRLLPALHGSSLYREIWDERA